MQASWTKSKGQRFSAIINGVFIGVGIIFLIWGATDIAFPIAERMSVAVFGLMRIILGIVSLSVGVGVEAVQWTKITAETSAEKAIDLANYETTQPAPPQSSQPVQPCQPAQTAQSEQAAQSAQSVQPTEPAQPPQPTPQTETSS